MPTWCHMFNSTLMGNARVWFDDLPAESIDSYDDLKKAFLENYLQQKKCIKDPIELHNIKQWDGESTEDFVKRYKLEIKDVKGAPECMRISGFMHGITNPELIKHLNGKIPKIMDEMIKVTTSFLRGEVAASNHERKKSFQPWKQQEDISFPPLDEDEGTEGPIIIEAEIGGHCIHRMYVDGGSASEILANTTTGNNWRRRALRFNLDEFCGRNVTISIQQNYWKTKSQEATSCPVNSTRNVEAPGIRRSNYFKKQQVDPTGMCLGLRIRKNPSGYQANGRNKLCGLLQQNLDIFAWKPADMTGVPRHIAKHHLNVRKGCYPVRQKKRGQTADRNQAIQEEIGKLVEPGIMREVHYHDWLSNLVMGIKGSGNKLHIDGKVSVGPGACQKWSIELREYAIHYRPRVSVKWKILADFIVERPEEDSLDTLMEEAEEIPEPWILFRDGSSCTDGSGAGLILTNPEEIEFTYALRFRFDATNNEAKYEALIVGLKIGEQIRVPRSENKKANALSKIASTSFAYLSKQVLVEELKEKSISATGVLEIVEEEGDTWMTPIFKYLTDGTLPAKVKKPFYKWGIDIAGPFPEGHGKVKFLIVAIDYFTKWIEVKPVATITGNQIKKFIWDNIVCRFGLLGEIISDNGKQFQDNPFKDWCEKLCIRQHFASVKHPQTNGLVERSNCSLGEGIKARLDERSKNWMEELSHVLWAHRTMIKSSNGYTSFSLTYETKVVIPAEIGMPTLRTAEVDLA
ncbi:reverse transcriptase domain-containing protein [Tanacetum coccineum]